MLITVLSFLAWFILWYFIVLSFGYLILLIASIPEVFNRFKESEEGHLSTIMHSTSLPPVTVFIPVFNEEKDILDSISSVLRSDYLNYSVIIVNDGSTDKTLEKLITSFDLHKITPIIRNKIKTHGEVLGCYISKTHKKITVIDKEHTDKSDSLNVALNACDTPLCITLDADTVIEANAISKIIFQMLTVSHTLSVGGAIYVLNGCRYQNGQLLEKRMSLKPIYAFQVCEYLRSFLFNRAGWNKLGGALCYSGAFTLFELKAIIDIGGFDLDNDALDFEVISHLHAYARENEYPYKIIYTPSASAWTDVPGNLNTYWDQRLRWQYGTLKSLMRHKRMFLNPGYGITGLFTYPFYLLGETLGAVVELTAYVTAVICWYLGILDIFMTVLFVLVAWGFSTFLTMATALMSFITFNQYKKLSDLFWMLIYSVVENIGFRQFIVFNRVYATIRYVLGIAPPARG